VCYGWYGWLASPAVTGRLPAATSAPAIWRSTTAIFPRQVSLATLVKIAGRRWATEESFQASKDLTGLDDHQARRWAS